MNFKTFIENIFEAKRTRIHHRIKTAQDLMYDQKFLERIVQEKGVYVDDDNVPYFNDQIEFYDAEDFKSKFATSEEPEEEPEEETETESEGVTTPRPDKLLKKKSFVKLLDSEGGVYVSTRNEIQLKNKVFFDSTSSLEAAMEEMIANKQNTDWINLINYYSPKQFSQTFAGGGGIEEKEEIYSKREFDEDDESEKRIRKPKIRRFLSPGSKVRISPVARENRRVADAMRKGRGSYTTPERDSEIHDLYKKFPTDIEFDAARSKRAGERETEYAGGDVVNIELDEPITTDEGSTAAPGTYRCKVIDADGSDLNVKILDGELEGQEISFIPDVLVKEKVEEEE